MRNLFILVLVAGFRVAWTLTEGTPNCPVLGNWSDSESTKTLRAWSVAPGNVSTIDHMEFTMGGFKITHAHDETNNATKCIYNSPKFAVLVANASGPDYSSTEKTIVELVCANNLLFVDVLPLADTAIQETGLALRRRTMSLLSEEPQVPPTPPPAPAISPQFILVNITLPRRQEDDSNEYNEDRPQSNVDVQGDDAGTEDNTLTGAH